MYSGPGRVVVEWRDRLAARTPVYSAVSMSMARRIEVGDRLLVVVFCREKRDWQDWRPGEGRFKREKKPDDAWVSPKRGAWWWWCPTLNRLCGTGAINARRLQCDLRL